MSQQDLDQRYAALVDTDPVPAGVPDVAALLGRGRRSLRRRRALGGGLAVAAAAAVAVPVLVLGGGGSGAVRTPYATDPVSTSAPTSDPTSDPTSAGADLPRFPEPGEAPIPGGTLSGEWEDGTVLGEEVTVEQVGPYDEILYAATRPYTDPGDTAPHDVTYVALGVRVDGRVLRLVSALTPATQEAADGLSLYGGDRRSGPGALESTYLLVGALPGDHEVQVVVAGAGRPPTASSSEVLPGYTVFYDTGAWDEGGWDRLQPVPFDVATDDGRLVSVRERTYVP